MFNLILRSGAPENTGTHEGIETTATLVRGQAVHIASGKAVAATGELPIYGIVTEEPINGVVTVLKVTPDMIFRCPASATAVKGTKVTLAAGEGGVTGTPVGSGKFGATIVEKMSGGFAEVRFE